MRKHIQRWGQPAQSHTLESIFLEELIFLNLGTKAGKADHSWRVTWIWGFRHLDLKKRIKLTRLDLPLLASSLEPSTSLAPLCPAALISTPRVINKGGKPGSLKHTQSLLYWAVHIPEDMTWVSLGATDDNVLMS